MRNDLTQRLKALGADDRKIAALVQFDDDTIAALLDQVERADKAASDQKIAYKEAQPMPPTQLPPPAYVEENYRLFDMVDAIAESRGDAAANLYIRRLIGQTVKEYPQVAKRVLGATEATVRLAVYKAVAIAQPDATLDRLEQRFLELLREAGADDERAYLEQSIAEMEADDETDDQTTTKQAALGARAEQAVAELQAVLGNDEVDALLAGLATLPKDQLRQVAAQLATATAGGRSTVTDSGKQSAQKSYDPRRDALAIAFGADQTKGSRR